VELAAERKADLFGKTYPVLLRGPEARCPVPDREAEYRQEIVLLVAWVVDVDGRVVLSSLLTEEDLSVNHDVSECV
jgi:hypothetical protein